MSLYKNETNDGSDKFPANLPPLPAKLRAGGNAPSMIVENGSQDTIVTEKFDPAVQQSKKALAIDNTKNTLQPSSPQSVSKGPGENDKQSPLATVVSTASYLGDTLKQTVPLTKEAVKSIEDKPQYSNVQATSTVGAEKGTPVSSVSVSETEDGHTVVKVGSYYILPEKITNISIRVLSALYMGAIVIEALTGPGSLFKLIGRCWILCMFYEFVVGRLGLKDELPDLFLALHSDLLDALAEVLAHMKTYKDRVLDLAQEKQAGRVQLE
jgi:hypothetical protein